MTDDALPASARIGLSSAEVERVRRDSGWNEVAEKKPSLLAAFARRFWGASAWMIEAIVVLSLSLGRRADAVIAGTLLCLNAAIGFLQERRAERAVELLKRRLQVSARVLRDGRWDLRPARELVPGDVIRLRLGDLVPADARVLEGELLADESALTGESADVRRAAGEIARSGSLVRRGECTAVVTATGARTYFGRTIDLVSTARPKLHLDEIVGRLVRWLLLAVGATLAATIAVSLARGTGLAEVLPLALVLLMSAVPVALPVMFAVSTAAAAHELAKRGVLVTRLSAAEDAATMDTLFVDKTGTMTLNRLTVAALAPAPNVSEEELLIAAGLASDAADRDPIDVAVLAACAERVVALSRWTRSAFIPFSPETRRTEARARLPGGPEIAFAKGAAAAVAQWASVDPNAALAAAEAERQARAGLRSIAVARRGPEGARYLGLLGLQDPPRPDSRELIERLAALGVRVKMLTGDALPVASAIAAKLGLGEIVEPPADAAALAAALEKRGGLAGVYPETKLRAVEALQSAGRTVGMTGDGVNDAPALKRAEVGVAVSGATDAAKAAASVVLTTEGLSGIVDLVEGGRAVYQRILTWMVNKVSRTVLKTAFVAAGYLLTGRFVISAVGMLTVVLLTDFAKIALATDRARISRAPDNWNVGSLARLGALLGALMAVESLAILFGGARLLGISIDSPLIGTYSFLLLMLMAVFSVLSIRERGQFWSSRPSAWLAAALSADAAIGLIIATAGLPGLPPLPGRAIALIASSSAACVLALNDLVKRAYLRRRPQ